MHARAHTGLRAHVTFFHGNLKVGRVLQPRQCSPIRDECSWSAPTHIEVASLVSQNTTPRRARAFVCHLVLPCATVVVHARHVRHSLCPAIQLPQCRLLLHCPCLPHLPLLFACPNQKLRGTLGDILEDWGLSKHSDLWSGC